MGLLLTLLFLLFYWGRGLKNVFLTSITTD